MSSQSEQATTGRSPQANSVELASGSHGTAAQQLRPVCPVCGGHNREQSQFCADCGASLLRYCPHCGQSIGAELESCERCSLVGAQATLLAGRCQGCGFQNDQNAEQCEQCGARLLAKCPQCDALSTAAFNFCPRCGFNYSHLVTRAIANRLEGGEKTGRSSRRMVDFSSALMIALVALSVLVMVYILWQM